MRGEVYHHEGGRVGGGGRERERERERRGGGDECHRLSKYEGRVPSQRMSLVCVRVDRKDEGGGRPLQQEGRKGRKGRQHIMGHRKSTSNDTNINL
jgi:hypothetical protein